MSEGRSSLKRRVHHAAGEILCLRVLVRISLCVYDLRQRKLPGVMRSAFEQGYYCCSMSPLPLLLHLLAAGQESSAAAAAAAAVAVVAVAAFSRDEFTARPVERLSSQERSSTVDLRAPDTGRLSSLLVRAPGRGNFLKFRKRARLIENRVDEAGLTCSLSRIPVGLPSSARWAHIMPDDAFSSSGRSG
jgi:hypothetical protein